MNILAVIHDIVWNNGPARMQDATKWSWRVAAALFFVLVLILYTPVVDCRFIWDDENHIIDNVLLRSIQGLWSIWIDPLSFPQYYPVTLTSFWVEYQLYGLNPVGYHVVNVFIHAGNVILLWSILRCIGVPGAFFCAAIFAFHPVHVESVAWISERKNVLSAFFYLAAARIYIEYLGQKKSLDSDRYGGFRTNRIWWASFLCFFLSILSKSVTATLPAALLLLVWWKDGRLEKKDIVPLVPFFVSSLIFGTGAIYMEHQVVGAGFVNWNLSLLERVQLSGRIAWKYITDILFPMQQIFFYPKWQLSDEDLWGYFWFISFLVVLFVLWMLRKRLGRGPICAMLYYVGTISPVLGFLKVYPMSISYTADHFQYLASIGTIVLFSISIFYLLKIIYSERIRHIISIMITICVLLPLALSSASRIPVYKDDKTLFHDTINKNPKATLAYRNLGVIYFCENNHEKVISICEKAISNNAEDDNILINYASSLAITGKIDEACKIYLKSLDINPENFKVLYYVGLTYFERNMFDEAKSWFSKAADKNPGDPWSSYMLGVVAQKKDNFMEAQQYYVKALQLDPYLGEAKTALELLRDISLRPNDSPQHH